jgi:hypothetical protein
MNDEKFEEFVNEVEGAEEADLSECVDVDCDTCALNGTCPQASKPALN